MSKAKEKTAETSAKSSGAQRQGRRPSRLAPFFLNLLKLAPYKPKQGERARWMTAGGLGIVVGVGLMRFVKVVDSLTNVSKYVIAGFLAGGCGWLIYRIVNYPPFADFLVATEVEMNKVSWTSYAELKRATSVVLATVLLMTLFLFGVDRVWSFLLGFIGVLKVGDTSSFGEQAG